MPLVFNSVLRRADTMDPGPIEIMADNPQEAEELAANYWDEGRDGEFVTDVEEKE